MSRSRIASAFLAGLLSCSLNAQKTRDVYSDTWVGTDGLGRELPTFKEVGPPKKNKTVGIFYFITFGKGGAGFYDNTEILRSHPDALYDVHNPAWGPIREPHYWGKPLFGYYASDDEYVLRRHAELLSDAGVDVVVFDNSNGYTFDDARDKLMDVWENIRKEGGNTPQIAFLCPFGDYKGRGSSTVRELYDQVYKPRKYPDLWFKWRGKPLILYDQDLLEQSGEAGWSPSALMPGHTLGQTFGASSSFDKIGAMVPTYTQKGSGMCLSLFEGGPDGDLLATKTFLNVKNNSQVLLDLPYALPGGRYYLQMSAPVGAIGWWGYSRKIYHDGESYKDDAVMPGCRVLSIHYEDSGPDRVDSIVEGPDDEAGDISQFFTFRRPEAFYDVAHPSRSSWGWLQIYPQAPFINDFGQPEEVTVGVAQNYNNTVHNTAPMSFPGAFGRSYHAGKTDTREDAVNLGFNFAEQWTRALQLNPPFVFVTGWNEWKASLFEKWSSFSAPPAIFVDEFNEEYSRDIEPMEGGFGDDYYYQLVSFIRKYKGVRPIKPVKQVSIPMSADFAGWNKAEPEYRHWIGSEAHRSALGAGTAGLYQNNTGRNNIISAKVSYDANNVYFYAKTAEPLTSNKDRNWMLLFLKTNKDSKGWMGYDFVVDRHPSDFTTSLEKARDSSYEWDPIANVAYSARESEIQIEIPRSVLGIQNQSATIDFKWADNCYAKGDWTDFLLNGDVAPDGRFNYRAIIGK